jgi:two-component system sensor histidine kinase/response regulator
MRTPQMLRLVQALPGFNVAEALARLNNNIDCYKELLADLCNSLDAAKTTLRPLIREGTVEEALICLHGLKGMSGNLGATALNQAFEKMEQALSTSQEKRYEMLITQMEQTIQQSLAAIGAFLQAEGPPSKDTGPIDDAGGDLLVETLNLLASLLDQKRLDAVEVFRKLESLLTHLPPHPEFINLAAAIRRLDYPAAHKALTVLAASMNIVL